MSAAKRRKLYVGVDYGTTFSGISFVLSTASDWKDVVIIRQWPGASGVNLDKVPSKIGYLKTGKSTGQAQGRKPIRWGYEAKPSSSYNICSWTKLLLDNSRATEDEDALATSLRRQQELFGTPPDKPAFDVVSDYLEKLYAHCMETLTKHYEDSFLRITPIEFHLTVPAVWPQRARKLTLQAASKAGFTSRKGDSIKLVTEPEAGVLATLETPRNREAIKGAFGVDSSSRTSEVGKGLLVVDCGGGTVDLISYAVERFEPKLGLHEICAGDGDKCGSTFVDQHFHDLMGRRFGQAYDELPVGITGPGSVFMEDFQRIKHNFRADDSEIQRIHLEMNLSEDSTVYNQYYDFEDQEVLVSSSDLARCFDPCLRRIIELIDKQVNMVKEKQEPEIKVILLIGGFSCSDYLYNKVRSWGIGKGILTIAPVDVWSAIARGAALRGIQGSRIRSRRCRRHYGYTHDRVFERGRDDDEVDSTYEQDRNGVKTKLVKDCMDWFFHRNDEIFEDTVTRRDFTHHYTPSKGKKIADLPLYYCTLSSAPEKKNRSTQIKELGVVQFDLSTIDLSQSPHYYSKGRSKKYAIDLVLVVNPENDEGMMRVSVEWKGEQCGSNQFHFEFSDD